MYLWHEVISFIYNLSVLSWMNNFKMINGPFFILFFFIVKSLCLCTIMYPSFHIFLVFVLKAPLLKAALLSNSSIMTPFVSRQYYSSVATVLVFSTSQAESALSPTKCVFFKRCLFSVQSQTLPISSHVIFSHIYHFPFVSPPITSLSAPFPPALPGLSQSFSVKTSPLLSLHFSISLHLEGSLRP